MNRRPVIAAIAFLAVAVLLLVPLPFAWSFGWRVALLDLGHVPLFAAFVFALRLGIRWSLAKCVLIAITVAGLAEIVQHFVGRTASWSDWLNGILGALSAAFLLVAWQQRHSWKRVLASLLLAFAAVLWPLAHAEPVLSDAMEGFHDFNTLASFSNEGEMMRWETNQAELERELQPDGLWAGRVTFLPGDAAYSSVMLTPVVNDLHGYRKMCVSFTLEGEPLDLALSIRGGPIEGKHTNHYQVGQSFPPGSHTMRLSLDAAYKFGKPHGIDPSEVYFVQLFVVRPTVARTIRIHRVWVEN